MTDHAPPESLEATIDTFRSLRRQIEEQILPLAYSAAGRRFEYQAPLRMEGLDPGSYVVLTTDSGRRLLGQLVSQRIVVRDGPEISTSMAGGDGQEIASSMRIEIRGLQGDGVVLGTLDPEDGFAPGSAGVFADASVASADDAAIRAFLSSARARGARLDIGTTRESQEHVPLHATGFNRHTFLCGQSGSGKTYSLGVILEQLLLHTTLKIIVIDPNSDYVRLGEVADPAAAERWAAIGSSVHVARATDGTDSGGLRVRLGDLTPDAQAAVLGLDPIRDRDEYATLREASENLGDETSIGALVAALEAGPLDEASRMVLLRIRNLGLDRRRVLAGPGEASVVDLLSNGPRCLVLDTGTLPDEWERTLLAQAVLGRLWRDRARRDPVLVVIDEAHNVCPAEPADRVARLTTERCVQIAGEGRKFGLHLLLATQRPDKLDENVVSQCDNLVLMRMLSRGDVARLQQLFSFVPPALIEQALEFGLGEALVAGRLVDHPLLVRFGARITPEGGADLPTTWADGGAAD
jgi:DNA helicase HerA-like ATPase